MHTATNKEMEKDMTKNTNTDEVRYPTQKITQDASKKTIEIAHRMLQENMEVKFVSSVTGLSKNELIKIKANYPC